MRKKRVRLPCLFRSGGEAGELSDPSVAQVKRELGGAEGDAGGDGRAPLRRQQQRAGAPPAGSTTASPACPSRTQATPTSSARCQAAGPEPRLGRCPACAVRRGRGGVVGARPLAELNKNRRTHRDNKPTATTTATTATATHGEDADDTRTTAAATATTAATTPQVGERNRE